MKKSELISLRLKSADVEYINNLDESYGRTTSEKIRRIIEDSKTKEKSRTSFEDAFEYSEENFSLSRKRVLIALREYGLRSEILDIFYEWLVRSSSLYQTFGIEKEKMNRKDLEGVERQALDELFILTDKFIGLGMGQSNRVINSSDLVEKVKSLIYLSKSVDNYLDHKGL